VAQRLPGAGPDAGVDAIALADAVRIARRWFWDDVTRQRTERVNMMGAWAKIAANGLERVGAPSPELAARIAEDFAARRWAVMRLFPGVPEALAGYVPRACPWPSSPMATRASSGGRSSSTISPASSR